jgi:hypothetical protein
LTVETDVLFLNGIRNFGSLAEEIEIIARRPGGQIGSVTKRIVIEGVAALIKLIAQAVVRIFEFQSVAFVVVARQPGERVMGLRKARRRRIMA